jgi:lipopolysaccharide transport system permease protein
MLAQVRRHMESAGYLQSVFASVFGPLATYPELAWALAKREVSDRHAGQGLGATWVFIHPFLIMAVYVFVFSFVLRGSLGPTDTASSSYTLYILSGLIPWMSLQESMSKSCVAIVSNAALVKQMVFPVELLPTKSVLTSLFSHLIALSLLLLFVVASKGAALWTFTLLPILLLLQLITMMGLGYLLSALGVYLRDLKDLVQVFGLVGVYLVPVFYLPQWMPHVVRPLVYFNPLSYLVWCYQDALYFGRLEHWWAWCVWPAFSIGIFMLGSRAFTRLKTMFGNVL